MTDRKIGAFRPLEISLWFVEASVNFQDPGLLSISGGKLRRDRLEGEPGHERRALSTRRRRAAARSGVFQAPTGTGGFPAAGLRGEQKKGGQENPLTR